MPELTTFLAFLAAATVVVITPGITVSAVVSTALARGYGAGLWLELGVQLGRLSMILIVAFALEAVVGAVGVAFDVIKYAGAAYLLWLGWGYLRSSRTVDTTRPVRYRTAAQQVLSGFLVLWGNPKAVIFFGAFLPQFVNPAFPAWPQVVALGLIEMALGLLADGSYILIAARARSALTGSRALLVNRIAGGVLILAAAWLAFSHR